jgi:DNA-binding NarL/FixJ family response regulator
MSLPELLAAVKGIGGKVVRQGDRVVVDAPPGTVTPQIEASIIVNRTTLEAMLPKPVVVPETTVSEDDEHLFESIKAGANGYLLKNVRPEVLFEDLRGVMRGEAPIAPGIANKLLEALRTGGVPLTRRPADDDAVDEQLTPRETEILELVAEGLSNKEIAARLTITEGTVKNHVHNALERLHLSNRTQAAAFVVRHGRAASREPAAGSAPD